MNRQTKIALFGCGGLLATCALILLLVGPLVLALRLLGFRALGPTDRHLQTVVTPQPTLDWTGLQSGEALGSVGSLPQPIVSVLPQTVAPVSQVRVQIQGQVGMVDTSAVHAERVEQGQTSSGQTTYYAEYNETGANALADDLLTQYAPPDLRAQLRNPAVQFRPSVVVLQAEANLPMVGWQPTSVVMLFNETGTQFTVTGVEIGGTLFATPPTGPIADWVNLLLTEGNKALREVRLGEGQSAAIRQIYIDHNRFAVIAQ